MKKGIIIFSLLIILLSISAVSANENITTDEQPEPSTDDAESTDLNNTPIHEETPSHENSYHHTSDDDTDYTQCLEDVKVTITPSQKAVKVGDNLQLTITVKNIGKLPFKNLEISPKVDKESLYLISASSSKGRLTNINGFLSLKIDYLNPGETATIILKTKALTKGDSQFTCDIGTYGETQTDEDYPMIWATATTYSCDILIEESNGEDLENHLEAAQTTSYDVTPQDTNSGMDENIFSNLIIIPKTLNATFVNEYTPKNSFNSDESAQIPLEFSKPLNINRNIIPMDIYENDQYASSYDHYQVTKCEYNNTSLTKQFDCSQPPPIDKIKLAPENKRKNHQHRLILNNNEINLPFNAINTSATALFGLIDVTIPEKH